MGKAILRVPHEKLLERLQDLNCIEKEFIYLNGVEYPGEKLVARQEPKTDFLSAHELRCIKFVSDYFRDYSASRISEYSHREEAYIKTRHQTNYDFQELWNIPPHKSPPSRAARHEAHSQ